jgi:hypothetical protein
MKIISLSALSIILVAGGCASSPSAATSTAAPQPAVGPLNLTGSPDARSAVLAFLDAGKNGDLQALATFWGSSAGSVREVNNIPRDEMEKRELVMLCYLAHDSHQIISDAQSANNERVVAAQLRRGGLTRTANFYAVAGPNGRWYVRQFDMEALTDFCKAKGR